MDYPELLDCYWMKQDVPWDEPPAGHVVVRWGNERMLQVWYDHPIKTEPERKTIIGFARAKFVMEIAEDVNDELTILRMCHIGTVNLLCSHPDRPFYGDGGREHASHWGPVLTAWIKSWLDLRPEDRRVCGAAAAHNRFVRTHHDDSADRDNAYAEALRAVQRTPAVLSQMLMHESAAVRLWAQQWYVPWL